MSFLISLSAWFRDRPSVSSKNGKSPWMVIMISFSSLVVAYMYLLYALNANIRSILLPIPPRSAFGKPASPAEAPSAAPVGAP